VRDYTTRSEKWNAHNVTVFVHGHNEHFSGVIKKAAALSYKLNCVTVVFDWASKYVHGLNSGIANAVLHVGRKIHTHYSTNRRRVEKATVTSKLIEVTRAFKELDKEPKLDLHIIAHSMGNYLLYKAVQQRLRETPDATLLQCYKYCAFAAPDISHVELHAMVQSLQCEIEKPVLTLYCSSKDGALKASGCILLHNDCRAGYYTSLEYHVANSHPFIANGVVTIDASNTKCEDTHHHAYHFDSTRVQLDISSTLQDGAAPDRTEHPILAQCETCFRSPTSFFLLQADH
jgi:esterase/lipase superfamily enzyme